MVTEAGRSPRDVGRPLHEVAHPPGGIGVRGVFLQRGGISQPSILLACFNSAGGVNAGL